MFKRALTVSLWFVTGWTFGNVVALAVGTPALLGPLAGLAFAAMAGLGPHRLEWRRNPTVRA